MFKLLIVFIIVSVTCSAHPGVGIVKDSKGNIYYTDLERVWKISNGQRTVLVPNVHTHELYVSAKDELYGEGGYYDNSSKKFYHYLWVYRGNGRIDTVIGMKQAYVEQDFSLARDPAGNEYYIKRDGAVRDTMHIYKKSPEGKETAFAQGNFGSIAWLHPQDNGTVLYVKNNALFKVDSTGKITQIKQGIGSKPTFIHSRDAVTLFGAWRDKNENYYVAVFSDQVVKKIDKNGGLTEVYKSTGNWTPLHGVFDNNDRLWILETNDKNEVKATMVNLDGEVKKKRKNTSTFIIIAVVLIAAATAARKRKSDDAD
jgi:hypothetical protein